MSGELQVSSSALIIFMIVIGGLTEIDLGIGVEAAWCMP